MPVEHRVAGLDRRTFGPALIVLAVAVALIYGLQALNSAIPWHNEIKAGDVLDLGAGATAVPPVGWQLESGTLTGSSSPAAPTGLDIRLAHGGAVINLVGASFTGSADAFLDQVEQAETGQPAAVDADRGSLTTQAGLVGVVQSRSGPSGDELQAAFKMATGTTQAIDAAPALLVQVRTAPGQFEQFQTEVVTLLRSITPEVTR